MDLVLRRLKPAKGYYSLVHDLLLVALPLIIFALVRLNESQFTQLALILVVLSKWRMFAVRPRFWPANIRANSVDLMVGISIVLFMTHTNSIWVQLGWVIAYGFWLIYLKRANSGLLVSVQAGVGQIAGLSALYLTWADGPIYGLTLATGIICYLAARHFYESFDEGYARMLSYLWGYFGAALAWVLSHWLLYYGVFSQPVVLLTAIGYGLGALYYGDHHKRLNKSTQIQLTVIMAAIVIVVLVFSNWGAKLV